MNIYFINKNFLNKNRLTKVSELDVFNNGDAASFGDVKSHDVFDI